MGLTENTILYKNIVYVIAYHNIYFATKKNYMVFSYMMRYNIHK